MLALIYIIHFRRIIGKGIISDFIHFSEIGDIAGCGWTIWEILELHLFQLDLIEMVFLGLFLIR